MRLPRVVITPSITSLLRVENDSKQSDEFQANENVTWMYLRRLKIYRAYSIWFNSSDVGKFFLELNSKGLYQSSGNEK